MPPEEVLPFGDHPSSLLLGDHSIIRMAPVSASYGSPPLWFQCTLSRLWLEDEGKGEKAEKEEGRVMEQNGEESGESTASDSAFPLNVFG